MNQMGDSYPLHVLNRSYTSRWGFVLFTPSSILWNVKRSSYIFCLKSQVNDPLMFVMSTIPLMAMRVEDSMEMLGDL